MKKILSVVLLVLGLSSCNIINDIKYRDLYNHTDYFIEELYSFYGYESYGLEGTEYQRETANGEFQITPIGRLINVKRLEYTTNKEYEELKIMIEDHYKNNWKVKDVYICGYGTIMIDCRR